MRYALAVATVLGLASVAIAIDNRQLIKFENNCDRWNAACKAYQPKDKSLTFAYTLCEPGDYHGQDPDTEAKVYCTFAKKGQEKNGPFTLVNRHVAASIGATFVSP
ncbi:hypothetical protein OC834_004961 [Tilletia horrida]|uniref:Uncharacterized protein n=1 Tax=Tilletia horrida TaxID=155126 RepID=A0AAN6GCR7_9BASI|nr:hypothetical protein OC834_004961 [Tilletia horrida]KAK0534392.1 hypothetical protein OC842_002655 [Tilletia horrida]KAK0558594.1 hypothetical protein OC844_005036 [Tilletia horrida]